MCPLVRFLLIVVAIASNSGILAGQGLSRSEATLRIQASQAFREPKTVELLAGGRMPLNVTRNHYLVFQSLGLLDFQVKGAVAESRLTEKGKQASQGWRRSYTSSYGGADLWHVPLAERELVAVEEVVPPGAGSTPVALLWKWNPGPIGEAMRLSRDSYKAIAYFERMGGEWRLVEDGPRGLRTCLRKSEWSQ